MRSCRLIVYGLISWILTALVSCSQNDWEQEEMGASIEETITRADLIEYTIDVETAGTLDSLVEAGSYADAQKLIITGNISYEDVNYVDVNMTSVEVLDLSGAMYESESIEDAFLSKSSKIKEISLPGNITSIKGQYNIYTGSKYFCPFYCSSLISIILPESLTNIEDYAFYYCSSLASIILPENVASIGDYAFCGCSSLSSINIPESVTSIGSDAFNGCSSLTSINVPESVTSIGSSAFSGCSSLTSITLPESVTSIGKYAFSDCRSLTSVTLPKSVTSIGNSAFYYCDSLTSIDLPENLTSIGNSAFYYCESLTSITLPENLTSIGFGAFNGSSLTSINIPKSVTRIDEGAFYGCSSLTSVNIPESVTNIGSSAFSGCSSLASIILPESVTSIGNYAFYYCSSLTNITLPEGVTSIGDYAFSYCSSLTSITIPESVTSIGEYIFHYCSSLQKVICNSSVDLKDLPSTTNLYCWLIINRPDGNLPMYGPNWKNVIINGDAESLTLPYHKTADMFLPEEVKSIKKLSYTMTFEPNTNTSAFGVWKTIALPFKPTSITHAEKGTLAPFRSGVEGAKNFWLRELTEDGFKNVTQIEANHPYLIAMPYSNEYADKYNISGEVTFSAENLTEDDLVNRTPLSSEGTDYTMYASYSYMKEPDGVYVLTGYGLYKYNQFVNNGYDPLYPFEAYLKANTATLRSVISLNTGRAATRAGGEGKREPQIDDM